MKCDISIHYYPTACVEAYVASWIEMVWVSIEDIWVDVEAYVASWIEIDLTERPTIPAGVEAYVASWIEID